jgi:hypothetical protein
MCEPCMCGDPYCPRCGPLMGYSICPVCREVECEQPEECERKGRSEPPEPLDAWEAAHAAWRVE